MSTTSTDTREAARLARMRTALESLTDQEVAVLASALDLADTAANAPDAPVQDDMALATLDRLRRTFNAEDVARMRGARQGAPTPTVPGREVAAGMTYQGQRITAVEDRCTWQHGSAGRVATLANGDEVMFHGDLPLHGVTRA